MEGSNKTVMAAMGAVGGLALYTILLKLREESESESSEEDTMVIERKEKSDTNKYRSNESSSFFHTKYKIKGESLDSEMEQQIRDVAEDYLKNVELTYKDLPGITQELREVLLHDAKIKICRVPKLSDFFGNLKFGLNPLTEESMSASGEKRYALADVCFYDDYSFVF